MLSSRYPLVPRACVGVRRARGWVRSAVTFARESIQESGGLGLSLLELSRAQVASGSRTQPELVVALRKNGVLRSDAVAQALTAVDRALFIPPTGDAVSAGYAEPYENAPAVLDRVSGATLSTPHHHAVITELVAECILASRGPVRALDYGCGTGYLTHVIARLIGDRGGTVIGTDTVPSLVEFGSALCKNIRSLHSVELRMEPAYDSTGKSFAERAAESGERFDIIHGGFAIPVKNALCDVLLVRLLSPGGSFVGSLIVGDDPNGEQELVVVTKSQDDESLTKTIVQKPVFCQSMHSGAFNEKEARLTVAEKIDRVKAELEDWKASFAKAKGRAPSSTDLLADPVAKELFATFSRLRSKKWDA